MQLVYSLHRYFHLPQWKRLRGGLLFLTWCLGLWTLLGKCLKSVGPVCGVRWLYPAWKFWHPPMNLFLQSIVMQTASGKRQFQAQIPCSIVNGEPINVLMDARRQFNAALEKTETITTGRAPVITEKINGAVTRDVLTTKYLLAGEEKSRAQYRYLRAIAYYLK